MEPAVTLDDLVRAIEHGDGLGVRHLLADRRLPVRVETPEVRSAVALAAERGQLGAFEALLADSRFDHVHIVLSIAATLRNNFPGTISAVNADFLERLCDATEPPAPSGADAAVSAASESRLVSTWAAAVLGEPAGLRSVLTSAEGLTVLAPAVLRIAAAMGYADIVQQVLQVPDFDLAAVAEDAAERAASFDQAPILSLLLSDPRVDRISGRMRSSAFVKACSADSVSTVRLLCASNLLPPLAFVRGLRRAASKGHVAVLEVLLATPGDDVSIRQAVTHAAKAAASGCNADALRLLLADDRFEASAFEKAEVVVNCGFESSAAVILADPRFHTPDVQAAFSRIVRRDDDLLGFMLRSPAMAAKTFSLDLRGALLLTRPLPVAVRPDAELAAPIVASVTQAAWRRRAAAVLARAAVRS